VIMSNNPVLRRLQRSASVAMEQLTTSGDQRHSIVWTAIGEGGDTTDCDFGARYTTNFVDSSWSGIVESLSSDPQNRNHRTSEQIQSLADEKVKHYSFKKYYPTI